MSHTEDPPATSPSPLDHRRQTGPARREVCFWFEGKKLIAHADDSIAKALFDNGIRVFSRSVKYGRPRSIHCGRGRCVMCHVEVDGVTGVKSCITPIREGMRIARQDYKPFYGSFFTRIMRRVNFPAGFYYRMFTRPRLVREAFIGTIRQMAGVGRINHRLPNRPKSNAPRTPLSGVRGRYDVVVIGAGLSGMSAAESAARAGADVLLVDEYAAPGGHSVGHGIDAGLASVRDDLIRRLQTSGSPTVAQRTTALGYYDTDGVLLGCEGNDETHGSLKTVSAPAVIIATGAQDNIPLFENNDLPGVFGTRGLRLFLERDGLVPGRTAVVYGKGRDLEEAVGLLQGWGIRVAGIVGTDPGYRTAPKSAAARCISGAKLIRAEGRDWISRAVFDTGADNLSSIPCDLLCVALPGQPAFELAYQAGFEYAFTDDAGEESVLAPVTDTVGGDAEPLRFVVGSASGRFEWTSKIEHASAVGEKAAGRNPAR
jgi:sarcosine oxidase subunit alpha